MTTIPSLIAARGQEFPQRQFISFQSGDSLTFGDLDSGAAAVAAGLIERGIDQGSVATMLPNRAEYLHAWAGVLRAGLVETPINTALRGDFLAHVLRVSESVAAVVDVTWLDAVLAVGPELPKLRHLFVVGGSGSPAAAGTIRIERFEALLESRPDDAPELPRDPMAPACVMFTSGTTGPSKGAIQSHRHCLEAQVVPCMEAMAYQPGEVLFTPLPMFHTNARYCSVLLGILLPGRVVMHSSFSASRFWDICRDEEATAFNFIGSMLTFLSKQPERPSDRDHLVRKAFGAPAPLPIYKDFEQRFGIRLCEVYGSTEIGVTTANAVESARPGTAGRSTGIHEIEIHDELGNALPDGASGELVVRPNKPGILFSGYYGMAEQTVDAWRNLWFHTGDRGRFDEDGYFQFVDRVKDSIRRRGENISSWEVERVVNSIPAVQESAVLGVPSEASEEDVLVAIVGKDGSEELTPEELLGLLDERLPPYAMPRYVRFLDELPKTPTGRVEKFKLRAKGVLASDWDRDRQT